MTVIKFYQVNGAAKSSREFNVSSASIYRWVESYEGQGAVDLLRGFKLDKDKTISRLNREIQAYKEIIAEKELALQLKKPLLKKSITKAVRLEVALNLIASGSF